MKFYLAHSILARKWVRKQELKFEKTTGHELVNPFYDGRERGDIVKVDAGLWSPYDMRLDPDTLVEGDLNAIDECQGILAFVSKKYPSIGTYCEIWYAYAQEKPVYIISPDWFTHPWLRYVTNKSKGRIVKNFDELAIILDASDRALGWVEGIIDGDGSIGLYRTKRKQGMQWQPRVTITNTDKRILETAKNIIGGVITTLQKHPRHKQCYSLVLSSNQIRIVLPKLKFVSKERQRLLLLEAVSLIAEHLPTKGRCGSTAVNNTRLVEIEKEFRTLNKRGNL